MTYSPPAPRRVSARERVRPRPRAGRLGVAMLAGVVTVATPLAPAAASGGEHTHPGTTFFLADDLWTTHAETVFTMDSPAASPTYLVGDVDGAGPDILVERRDGAFLYRAVLGPDATPLPAPDDNAGYETYLGDWYASGRDHFAQRGPGTNVVFFPDRDEPQNEDEIREIPFGRPGDDILVGDWDGNGTDTLAMRRGNTVHLKNSLGAGAADVSFTYGRADDEVLVGDWDDDGVDSFAMRRGNQIFFRNAHSAGRADRVVDYGRADDQIVVGDWDDDGVDTLGVRRRTGPLGPTYSARVAATFPVPPDLPAHTGFTRALTGPVEDETLVVSATRPLVFPVDVLDQDLGGVALQRATVTADGEQAWSTVDFSRARSATRWHSLSLPGWSDSQRDTYRLAVLDDRGWVVFATTPTAVRRSTAADHPAHSVGGAITEVIAPYCPDVPVLVPGEPLAEGMRPVPLVAQDDLHVAAYSLVDTRENGSSLEQIRVREPFLAHVAAGGGSDPLATHIALHECAHVVMARWSRHDEAGFRALLAHTYPDLDARTRWEAGAVAVADHWARNNPGGVTSKYFVPTYADGRTAVDAGKASVGFDVREYADDPFVRAVTDLALSHRL